jgi:hypothetical protein
MTYISGVDRCQLRLLPEAIDDYVGSDNPVRFIDASTSQRWGFAGHTEGNGPSRLRPSW